MKVLHGFARWCNFRKDICSTFLKLMCIFRNVKMHSLQTRKFQELNVHFPWYKFPVNYQCLFIHYNWKENLYRIQTIDILANEAVYPRRRNIKIIHEENKYKFYLKKTSVIIFYVPIVYKMKTFPYAIPVWFRYYKKRSKHSHLIVVLNKSTSWLLLKSQYCGISANSVHCQLLIDILLLICLISPYSIPLFCSDKCFF